ncbi:MAG: ATP-binding protein [Rothia sp. (in: high G+C Gram-positive bacteria)]|nr:ATP-binding protein [Rothia sp. (in: high G+C Gram-positive bacteria)]
MQHTTGATKDLARSLRKPTRSFPRPWPTAARQLVGPSSFVLFCALEIFFAFFGVVVIFQAFMPLFYQNVGFHIWHICFASCVFVNSMWLIYNGIRREFSPAIVAATIWIAYLAYLTYPLVAKDTGDNIPWYALCGLYGLLTPLTTASIRQVTGHIVALAATFFGSTVLIYKLFGLDIHLSILIPEVIQLVCLSLLFTFFFGVAKYYAERSDVLYTETLAAQLQFNRTKDQAHTLQEFDKLVHDNVMAALLDASRDAGPIAERTRTLARRAIAVLEDETNRVSPIRPATFQELTEQIAVGVSPWNSRLRFVEDADSRLPQADPASEMPQEAARAFTHAVTEAVSNSARHSGSRTTQISVRTEMRRPLGSLRSDDARPHIYCTVSDRGQGFNMNNIDLRRMGVRVSMIRSMAEAGGKVTIKSAPERGTVVIVQWPGDQSNAQ